MNTNLKTAFIFIAGVISGSIVTNLMVKNRYEAIANEEIESVKASYDANSEEEFEQLDEGEVIVPEAGSHPVKKDITDYSALAAKYKAEDEEENTGRLDVQRIEPIMNPNIYEIDEAEYGEMDTFDMIECTLYADGVLAEDDDGIIDDVDGTVGSVNIEKMDEDNNILYIRNEVTQTDYAISYDTRDYVTAQKFAHRVH